MRFNKDIDRYQDIVPRLSLPPALMPSDNLGWLSRRGCSWSLSRNAPIAVLSNDFETTVNGNVPKLNELRFQVLLRRRGSCVQDGFLRCMTIGHYAHRTYYIRP